MATTNQQVHTIVTAPSPTTSSMPLLTTTTYSNRFSTPATASMQNTPHVNAPHYQFIQPTKIILPNYTHSDPQLWFLLCEEQFNLHNIHDENARYSNTITALPHQITAEVRDIITHKPVINPYTTLKQQILERLGASLNEQIKKLLEGITLGDRRPSQMLVQMQALITDSSGIAHNGAFVRNLFINKLPNNVKSILATTEDDVTLQGLAKIADRVLAASNHPIENFSYVNHVQNSAQNFSSVGPEQHCQPNQQNLLPYDQSSLTQQVPTYNQPHPQQVPPHYNTYQQQVHPHQFSQPIPTDQHTPHSFSQQANHNLPNVNAVANKPLTLQQISQDIQNLTVEFNKLKDYVFANVQTQQYGNRGRNQSRGRSQSPHGRNFNSQNSNSNTASDLCYYHNTYGDKAIKFQPGCKFYQGN